MHVCNGAYLDGRGVADIILTFSLTTKQTLSCTSVRIVAFGMFETYTLSFWIIDR